MKTKLVLGLILSLVALASLLPSVGYLTNRYWSGFFYAPFYTTNVFSDPTNPAIIAGIEIEDRVIGANKARIEELYKLTQTAGANQAKLVLVYEFVKKLAATPVQIEQLSWGRLLDKWGPLLLTAFGLILLAFKQKAVDLPLFLAALAMLSATDYWFNAGTGRNSGFEPSLWWADGFWDMMTAKWSTYLYYPLWTLVWVGLISNLVREGLKGQARGFAYALIGSIAAGQIAGYSYEAFKTFIYNNPNYIIWHIRVIVWPLWGSLLIISLFLALKNRTYTWQWLRLVSFVIFVVGFALPTAYDKPLGGLGTQWYSLGLFMACYGMVKLKVEPTPTVLSTQI